MLISWVISLQYYNTSVQNRIQCERGLHAPRKLCVDIRISIGAVKKDTVTLDTV